MTLSGYLKGMKVKDINITFFKFFFIKPARTSYIPPKEPIFSSGRFQRNVSQPGQSSRKPGLGPPIRIPPAVISPQSGQVRPSPTTTPTNSTPASSLVSPSRPVFGGGGKMPVNGIMTSRPTIERPPKWQPHVPPLVPEEGNYYRSSLRVALVKANATSYVKRFRKKLPHFAWLHQIFYTRYTTHWRKN